MLTRGTAQVPERARQTLLLIAGMIDALSLQIRTIGIDLRAWHRAHATGRRQETIPGIGFITATALAATVEDAKVFRSGRQSAAWLGLVPKQHSPGGKERMGGISKMGGPLSVPSPRGRSDRRHPLQAPQNNAGQHLGRAAAQAQAGKAGKCRHCRHDGTDRLGCHDERRELPRSSGYRLKHAQNTSGQERAARLMPTGQAGDRKSLTDSTRLESAPS